MSEASVAIENMVDKTEANAAWKGDSPTQFIEKSFEKGLIKSGQTVIDIGCGFGRNSNYLESQGAEVIGVNINSKELEIAIAKAKESNLNTSFIEGSATELPLGNSSCEVAIDSGCSHMLSAQDQIKTEKEQARVVKAGGHLLYFGFSKNHPSYTGNPTSSMFRNLDDVKRIYGGDFEVISSENIEWKPALEENANFDMHRGINVVMKRKVSVK